jgi:serine/threonine-protein kinase
VDTSSAIAPDSGAFGTDARAKDATAVFDAHRPADAFEDDAAPLFDAQSPADAFEVDATPTNDAAAQLDAVSPSDAGATACGSSDASASSPGADAAVGTDANSNSDTSVPDAATSDAGALAPARPFKQIAVGGGFACVIDANDAVACWGANSLGQTGAPPAYSTPSLQIVQGVSGVSSLALGDAHACALSAGMVWCWGSNIYDQLAHPSGTEGDGTCALFDSAACATTPVKVDGIGPVRSISAAGNRVCALTQDGNVWCWGETAGAVIPPNATSCGGNIDFSYCFATPTQDTNVSGLSSLAISRLHACGIASGALECWGDNSFEEISDSVVCPNGETCAAPVSRADLGAVASFGLGENVTCVTRSGCVACFGRNDEAQLAHAPGTMGDGSCFGTPGFACNGASTAIASLAGARALAVGAWSSCVIASDGAVACWGSNGDAELGHAAGTHGDIQCGSSSQSQCSGTPTSVDGITGATALAAGLGTACAIDGASHVWCWGHDGNSILAPTRVDP